MHRILASLIFFMTSGLQSYKTVRGNSVLTSGVASPKIWEVPKNFFGANV